MQSLYSSAASIFRSRAPEDSSAKTDTANLNGHEVKIDTNPSKSSGFSCLLKFLTAPFRALYHAPEYFFGYKFTKDTPITAAVTVAEKQPADSTASTAPTHKAAPSRPPSQAEKILATQYSLDKAWTSLTEAQTQSSITTSYLNRLSQNGYVDSDIAGKFQDYVMPACRTLLEEVVKASTVSSKRAGMILTLLPKATTPTDQAQDFLKQKFPALMREINLLVRSTHHELTTQFQALLPSEK